MINLNQVSEGEMIGDADLLIATSAKASH